MDAAGLDSALKARYDVFRCFPHRLQANVTTASMHILRIFIVTSLSHLNRR